jgi:hypothetical protein
MANHGEGYTLGCRKETHEYRNPYIEVGMQLSYNVT